MPFVTYKLKRAYLLRILALEASSWLQITFYIITNALTSYFERFGLTVLRKYTFQQQQQQQQQHFISHFHYMVCKKRIK